MAKLQASSKTTQILLLAAQTLTLISLLLGLNFLVNTTGGTLFMFSTFGPVLVFLSIAILVGVGIYKHNTSHDLFDIETFNPGEIIFREGDIGDCAYFIHSGEVEVLKEQQGKQQVIAKLGKDQYFGEMALITNARRNATIRAASKVCAAALGKNDFLTMLSVLPGTKEDILKTVQARAMEHATGRR